METGKLQPEGPREMRLTEFPTGTLGPRVEIVPISTEHQ